MRGKKLGRRLAKEGGKVAYFSEESVSMRVNCIDDWIERFYALYAMIDKL